MNVTNSSESKPPKFKRWGNWSFIESCINCDPKGTGIGQCKQCRKNARLVSKGERVVKR